MHNLRSIEANLRIEPRRPESWAEAQTITLRLDLRGRLDRDDLLALPHTGLDAAAQNGPPPKPNVRRLLDSLPSAVVATALVELAGPWTIDEVYRLLARHGIAYPDTFDIAIFLEPTRRPGAETFGTYFDQRVSWPRPALAQFQAWVKTLRRGDDRVLDSLGLPSRDRLREIAARARVYGFVLDKASPARLRGFLDEPSVRSLQVVDAAFDLEPWS